MRLINTIFTFALITNFFHTTAHTKNILIFNATSHIGQTLAQDISSKGADSLLITARNTEKLADLKKASTVIHHDFSNTNTTELTKVLKENNKGLDGIVLILPRPQLGPNLLPKPTQWQSCFNDCFINPLEALRSLLPYINQNAKVVIIGGITSKQVLDNHQQYAILRHMWVAQAKGLSRQLAKRKIHINTLALSGTMTDSFRKKLEQRAAKNKRTVKAQYAKETDNIPLKDYATPSQVSKIIQFFLSDASSYITGVNLPIDGGFNKGY